MAQMVNENELRENGAFDKVTESKVLYGNNGLSTVTGVWKQWTDELRTTRKTGRGRRKVTSVRDDRHLLRMAVNDRTASSRQLKARWSTATGVLMPASSIRRRLLHRGLGARVPLYRIPLAANQRRLRLQWAHEHRAWQADWHQVIFSDESCFNLWDHDSRICVRRYADERCLPECVIERHRGITPGVMVWGVNSYHGRSMLLRIKGSNMGSLVVRASDSRPEGLGSMLDATKYPPSTHGVRAR
ncbi:transposable element Tc1 transposase [Trichonephila clavipes]|nr:transposable element Tc1 transposase [Trichonephila clavipes]